MSSPKKSTDSPKNNEQAMKKWFKRNKKDDKKDKFEKVTRGLLVFAHPTTVISVEEILRDEGYDIRVVSPPPTYRTGCDLSVEFPAESADKITELLNSVGMPPLDVIPITSKGMQPLQFVRSKEFDNKYLMIRAANMKMTVDKDTKEIVNISGGGCPDVPYMATEMIGKRLRDVKSPGEVGYSLCAYALNNSYDEIIKAIGD